ncbi:sialidase family protein [uncultured Proteiniphilum sp.]|uniref:sialidase family protein n=1 Tax=uncultured Proteiniphilum sp. TaxID=497637 RepID=UPI00260D3616|nr:sialidase family protein [uncultured Proteiniphilum sp.]
MKKLFLGCLFFCFSLFIQATDTIQVKQTKIPILIDRSDNVLFYIRIDARNSKILDEIKLRFAGDTNLGEIASVKLYYGGTEAPERKENIHYAPVQYISSHNAQGKTREAIPSYSIKIGGQPSPANEVVFKPEHILFPGINYFWVSLQMKPNASLLSKVDVDIASAKLDGKNALIAREDKPATHRMGIGVRHAGDDGAAAYRIPGLATSKEGTLLAVYDIRYNNSVDLQEYVDVGLSRSTDKGQSWEDMRIPLSFGQYGGLPKAQNGVGDPAILVDTKAGTIWVIALWTHGMGNRRAWHNSQAGMDINETGQLVLAKSTDDGKTWSEPINITQQVKDPSWRLLLQGPGRGITMQDGTLVFPIQFIDSTSVPFAGIMYSKDGGETWKIHNPARPNTTEAQVAETAPGLLMLNMRDNRGGSRAISTTKDLGLTWMEHSSSRKALQEPVCMASLLQVNAKDNVLNKDILVFSNPNSNKERNKITIKISLDGGASFPDKYQLLLDEDHGWGYSCLTMIDRETIGIIYESSVAHMTFQAVKLTDIIPD